MPTRSPIPIRPRLLAGLLLVPLLLASCSDDGSPADTASADGGGLQAPSDEALAVEGDPAAAEAGDRAAEADVDVAAVDADRRIVRTARVELEVDGAGRSARDVVAIAEAAGGFVAAEATDRGEAARTLLTLRIPPERFRDVLDEVAGLGDLRHQEISTDDVTEQAVDLESRITTAEASVARLRDLLARADRLDHVARLETELLDRETQLELLRGQQRTLRGQVALATITVQLTSAADEAPPIADGEDRAGFADGLTAGLDALVLVGTSALALLGLVLPWVPVALALWLGARALRHRRAGAAAEGA